MSVTVRAATFAALALAALALLVAAPAAGETNATAEAWIDVWFPQRIDTDGDGAADGFNNSFSLNTTEESLNVTVEMVVYRNGTPLASLSSDHTLHPNATTGWGWPAGYWVALVWNASENGSYGYEIILYNETGAIIDNRSSYGDYALIAPGEGVLDFTMEIGKEEVELNVRPGATGVGCTTLRFTNTGDATIDIVVHLTAPSLALSPSALSLTLAIGDNRTIPACVAALTHSAAREMVVTVSATGRDAYAGEERTNRTASFMVRVLPYARLLVLVETPLREACIVNIISLNFTVVNHGNTIDDIAIAMLNRGDLEAVGFVLNLSLEAVTLDPDEKRAFVLLVQPPPGAGNLTAAVVLEVRSALEQEAWNTSVTVQFYVCESLGNGNTTNGNSTNGNITNGNGENGNITGNEDEIPGFAATAVTLALGGVAALTRRRR